MAQNNLGVCYENGNGVTPSYTEAAKWYRLAAEKGHSCAQYNMGCCYWNGRGVTKSRTTAISWWKKAAAQGDEDAQRALKEEGIYSW